MLSQNSFGPISQATTLKLENKGNLCFPTSKSAFFLQCVMNIKLSNENEYIREVNLAKLIPHA